MLLKLIKHDAGISVKLHSHLGRQTFATYILSHDVMVENLQQMLGHKGIAMTQRDAKILVQFVHDEFDMIEHQLRNKALIIVFAFLSLCFFNLHKMNGNELRRIKIFYNPLLVSAEFAIFGAITNL